MDILVLMSTYNGEKYLKVQLDSILSQLEVTTHFAIRDDGSSDGTFGILQQYKNEYPDRFDILIKGSNLGPSASFAELVSMAQIDKYSYFAFGDQDDYWMPQKLISGINKLKQMDSDGPKLYLSNLSVTDENLNVRFLVYKDKDVTPIPKCCFVDFYASCNTFVCNREALALMKDAKPHNDVYVDVWYFFVCVFMGNVCYDPNSYILFRRYGGNASGSREQGLKLLLKRLEKLKNMIIYNGGAMRRTMAIEMLNKYGNQLDTEKVHILKTIAEYQDSFYKKCKLIFDPKVKSRSMMRNFHMVIRVLLNQF